MLKRFPNKRQDTVLTVGLRKGCASTHMSIYHVSQYRYYSTKYACQSTIAEYSVKPSIRDNVHLCESLLECCDYLNIPMP
ncbi:hypothetical protein H8356DRAFT_1336409 [Neocallimastix lanati (nom. inval.)]|nr:hypothetical protein H8356DRAFT_1336409 [Neocallimastix sp. JGI-2020a]